MQEDLVFVYSYLLKINNIMFIPDILYVYCVYREDSTTKNNKKDKSMWKDVFIAFSILKNRIKKSQKWELLENTFYQAFIFACLGNIKNIRFREKIRLIYRIRKKYSFLKYKYTNKTLFGRLLKLVCWGII